QYRAATYHSPLPTVLSNDDPRHLLRMRNETDHSPRPIHYHNRRSYMRILRVQPLDPEPVELRVGRHDRRVGAHVVLGGACLGLVPRGDRKSTRLNSSHEWISY